MNNEQPIGQTIKFLRQLKGLTQDAVAVGICTTSYLSRIENGLVTPAVEVYTLLFERLGYDYEAYEIEQAEQQQLLETIYSKLLSNASIEAELPLLMALYTERMSPGLQLQIDLVYCRYVLSEHHVDEGAAILARIRALVSPGMTRQWQLYVAIQTYYELMVGQYEDILTREEQTNSRSYLRYTTAFEQANYVYHLAFASHRAYQFGRAHTYIEQANRLFQHEYKPLFQLKLYSMHGVIFNSLGRFDAAYVKYFAAENLLQHVPAIATDAQWASLYNNLAFTYESAKQYEQALHYYERALAYQDDVHTRINYTRTLLFSGQRAAFVQQLTQLALEKVDEHTHHAQQLRLMAAFAACDDTEQFQKTTTEVMQAFTTAQHIELILSYGPLVAEQLEAMKQYKRVAALYRLLYETSETMRLRIGGQPL